MSEQRMSDAEVRSIHIVLLIFFAVFIVAILTKFLVFGSKAGLWVYPYIHNISIWPFLVSICSIAITTPALWYTLKNENKNPLVMIGLWLVLGTAVDIAIIQVRQASLEDIVRCPIANSFFTVVSQYRFRELFNQYLTLAQDNLPLHVRDNMPGKLFLYYTLLLFTKSPVQIGWTILVISNLAAIPVYLFTYRIFENERIAICSMVLYFLYPARILIFPLLNIVTPLFVMTTCWIFVELLRSDFHRVVLSILFGISVFATFIFEPTPLCMALFLALVTPKLLVKYGVEWHAILSSALIAITAFIVCDVLTLVVVGLDPFRVLIFLIQLNHEANIDSVRGYWVWVYDNMRNTLIQSGTAQMLLFGAMVFEGIRRLFSYVWPRRFGHIAKQVIDKVEAFDMATTFSLALIVVLLLLDVSGIIRGEVTRHWIFLMVFIEIAAVTFAADKLRNTTMYFIVASTILQTAICMSMVGFVQPFSLK